MIKTYEDILDFPYPLPTSRKRMSPKERGAQFSPFAALTGYHAAIQETERITEKQIELDTDGKGMIDEALRRLFHIQDRNPEVTLRCFIPDSMKSGGAFVEISGSINKIDPHKEIVVLTNGANLSFSQIYEINGDIFSECWEDIENNTQEDFNSEF